MRKVLATFTLLACLPLSLISEENVDELELVMSLRSLVLNCEGAGSTTKNRLCEDFYNDYIAQELAVASAAVTCIGTLKIIEIDAFPSIEMISKSNEDWCSIGKRIEFESFRIEFEGSEQSSVNSKHSGLRTQLAQDFGMKHTSWNYQAFNVSAETSVHQVTLEKDYQGIALSLRLLIPANQTSLIDDIRVGQKVTTTGSLFSMHFDEATNALYMGILSESVSTETAIVRCANGHEYAPTSGYRFCPRCGQPLAQ